MNVEAASIAAATAAEVVFSVGPVPFGSRVDGLTFWYDQTDDLAADAGLGVAADTFQLSVAMSDRPATDANGFSVLRPLASNLPLQSLGTPGSLYIRLNSRVKRNRFLVCRVRASNGGAAVFRFGAAVDFTSFVGPAVKSLGGAGGGGMSSETGD